MSVLPNITGTAYAQTTPPITSSGLNTTVTSNGNIHDITGGTRPENGLNLFHSFGEFGVPRNNVANFLNETALPTSNILGRVTGGNISNIFGMIQTTGFDNANLFLVNPAGFLFGPNATVNVGGMVSFTSADYLRLADNARFNTIPNAAADALLSASPVAAFGFLGSNPSAIAVQGSQFTVREGTGITLVGGNISVEGGTLSALSGQINLASVASPGEVSAATFLPDPGMAMGMINVSNGSTLDASGNAAGTVRIRGGQFTIADATLSADTGNFNGAPVAIDIDLTGDLTISDTLGAPAITARTTGAGKAGEVSVASANLNATTSVPVETSHTLIDTHSSGTGSAGSVTIATGNLTVAGPAGTFFFIDSGPQSVGPGGNVTITAQGHVNLTGTTISTGAFMAGFLGLEAGGPGGNLTLTADTLRTSDAHFLTEALSSSAETELGGDVTLNAREITMLPNSVVSAGGTFGGGSITVNADRLFTDATKFSTFTFLGPGKGITFTGRILELTNGSNWSTSTFGDFNAGDIHVTATDHVSLIGVTGTNALGEFNPSGFFSNSLGFFGTQGEAGNMFVTTPILTMIQGRMNTSTATSGGGGNVTIDAGMVDISGEFPNSTSGDFFFDIGNIHPSGIFTQTIGTDFCAGPCANAGNIVANIGTLNMGPGSQINSGTSNNGLGGTITINATNAISLSGTLSDGDPVGIFSRTIGTTPDAGDGGNIHLKANSFTIQDGAQLSASTLGSGAAGGVTVEGTKSPAQSVLIEGTDSGIFTNTVGTGAGGNILVDANTFTLQNGGTLSAATSGTANSATGGTITVNATQVELNTGKINASTGGPGDAGVIHINATDRIALTNRAIIASASENLLSDAQGNGGTITLHAPHIVLSGNALVGSSTTGPGNAGNIVLETQSLIMSGFGKEGGRVITNTQGPGQGGNITVRGLEGPASAAEVVQLRHGSQLLAQTIGGLTGEEGNAGSIHVRSAILDLDGLSQLSTAAQDSAGGAGTVIVDATDSVRLSGGSSITSNSAGASLGQAGDITITSPTIGLQGASFISTSTEFVGNAGNITLHTQALSLTEGSKLTSNSGPQLLPEFSSGAAGSVTIQKQGSPTQSILIDGASSGMFTNTEGTGAGGNITLSANTVTLQNGGTLSAKTSGTAASATGGTITVDATDQVTMTDGASVSAGSTGPANAGNILIDAGQTFVATNSNDAVTTQADVASGGNITVVATEMIQLTNSRINASVEGSKTTVGGNIMIDPQVVILQNSQILAEATQGNGGEISITTNLLLQDANSRISASSQFGLNGTVTIQSPNSPASGQIQPLGNQPLEATSLLNQRCAALAGGEFSSFTVAGRDSLPTEPDSWLASPLVAFGAGEALGVRGEGVTLRASLAGENTLLSLRQIAPTGFLTQAFAADSSTGCS